MLELSDDGIRAINAIARTSSRLAAGEISQKGLQATFNLYGKTAFNAVESTIPGTIRHVMIKNLFTGAFLFIGNFFALNMLDKLYRFLGR